MAARHAQRKITNEREARKCLAAARAAGQEVGRWARAHGLDGRSLNAWRMNLARRGGGEARARRPNARPPAARRVGSPRGFGLVELVPVPAPRPATAGRYTVSVGDLRLEFGDDVDAGTLRRVLAVLRAC